MVKAESCTHDHPLTCHWFGCILLCHAALCITGETVSKQLCQVEPCDSMDRAPRPSGPHALCSLCFLGKMDEWQGGLCPFQNLKWIKLTFLLFACLPSLSFVVFVWNSQHHWCGLFLHAAQEQRSRASLECFSHVFFLRVFVFLSQIPPTSSKSVPLPSFYPLVLMIYFAKMSDRCWNGVLSVTSRERFMSIIFMTTHWRQKHL